MLRYDTTTTRVRRQLDAVPCFFFYSVLRNGSCSSRPPPTVLSGALQATKRPASTKTYCKLVPADVGSPSKVPYRPTWSCPTPSLLPPHSKYAAYIDTSTSAEGLHASCKERIYMYMPDGDAPLWRLEEKCRRLHRQSARPPQLPRAGASRNEKTATQISIYLTL